MRYEFYQTIFLDLKCVQKANQAWHIAFSSRKISSKNNRCISTEIFPTSKLFFKVKVKTRNASKKTKRMKYWQKGKVYSQFFIKSFLRPPSLRQELILICS